MRFDLNRSLQRAISVDAPPAPIRAIQRQVTLRSEKRLRQRRLTAGMTLALFMIGVLGFGGFKASLLAADSPHSQVSLAFLQSGSPRVALVPASLNPATNVKARWTAENSRDAAAASPHELLQQMLGVH